MPCKEPSSKVTVKLDLDERLIDFDFSKITCHKEIGGGTGFKEYCLGRGGEEISALDFNDLVQTLGLDDPEDQFFLYLEWEALKTALAQFYGKSEKVDLERYRLASISIEEDQILIRQVIQPAKEMPKIIPCRKRSAVSPDQSG
ncbi:MAG: hypothetical protein ACE5E9_07605 [Nitrospinaceae bacterium]